MATLTPSRKRTVKALKSSGVITPRGFWAHLRRGEFGKAAAALVEQNPRDPEAELYADLIWAG